MSNFFKCVFIYLQKYRITDQVREKKIVCLLFLNNKFTQNSVCYLCDFFRFLAFVKTKDSVNECFGLAKRSQFLQLPILKFEISKMRLIDFSCGVCLCIFDLAQCDKIYRIINLCVYLL